MDTNSLNKKPHHKYHDIIRVLTELKDIREDIITSSDFAPHRLKDIHPNYQGSAKNLLHYLALRRRDLRSLQFRLATLGLSSLGRSESNVLATLDTVIDALYHLADLEPISTPAKDPVDFNWGQRQLNQHSKTLLGAARPGRGVRIMVTMPTDAAEDYSLVHKLLQQGMDCMRINCAHDDRGAWGRMIKNLRRAERALGQPGKVVMDLAGPKLRTGPLQPGPAVVKARPERDAFGKVIAPARIWLFSESASCRPPGHAAASLPLPESWLRRLRVGEHIRFTDARKAQRTLHIVEVSEQGCWAEASKTCYFLSGKTLHYKSENQDFPAQVGPLPPLENPIHLHRNDLLVVSRRPLLGHCAQLDDQGNVLTPATISCTLPEVFDAVQPGETIWFDDGKIGGRILCVESTHILVRITHARDQGEKLRADKGINLPDSQLQLPALTSKDIEDLEFASQHADIIELSFANRPEDVESLTRHLAGLHKPQPAIVLKIETRTGFENLPEMLLTAMRTPSCGVMIARGDLAVECGFERLAEVQEEILWLCEAAHVPVIWATQVLENLAKHGLPSRAEITDAAMSHRAECVMLNKGPHITEAVTALDNILRRMHTHQTKKRAMLRELHLAHKPPLEHSTRQGR